MEIAEVIAFLFSISRLYYVSAKALILYTIILR